MNIEIIIAGLVLVLVVLVVIFAYRLGKDTGFDRAYEAGFRTGFVEAWRRSKGYGSNLSESDQALVTRIEDEVELDGQRLQAMFERRQEREAEKGEGGGDVE